MTLKVDRHTASDAPLKGISAGADSHIEIKIGTGTLAVVDRLLDSELDEGLVDVVGLSRAVAASTAVNGATGRAGALHGKTFGVTNAAAGILAVGAVNKGDVVPELVVDDAVLELGGLGALLRLANLQRHASALERLRVLRASRHVNGIGTIA